MKLENIKSVYFIGIGGIGMSAVARYFLSLGKKVGGYDRKETELTRVLAAEGADIHYEDNSSLISPEFFDKESSLVVYTPAIPADHEEKKCFIARGLQLHKRAEVLGMITRSEKALCVAGTHGKTTTSAMAAHILHESHTGCDAFLGGITRNYNSNFLLSEKREIVVVEADEFDRSFHHLSPYISVITSCDPDHLDIYGTAEAYYESFRHYTSLIQPGGALIMHTGISLKPDLADGVRCFTYGASEGDFRAENVRIKDGEIDFDFVSPVENISGIRLGVPALINIDNGVAAMAMAQAAGATAFEIRSAMASFKGIQRRFDFKIKTPHGAFLIDYAHHPEELRKSILSMRALYPNRRISAVFQPHLYTRTRDFYLDFAESLSLLDEVVLTEIYPAREEPIAGVTSKLIFDNIAPGVEKYICPVDKLFEFVKARDFDVLMLLGAGDIADRADEITQILKER